MYHPDAMLSVAHTRENELIGEAQRCGLHRHGAVPVQLSRRILVIGLWLAALATALRMILV